MTIVRLLLCKTIDMQPKAINSTAVLHFIQAVQCCKKPHYFCINFFSLFLYIFLFPPPEWCLLKAPLHKLPFSVPFLPVYYNWAPTTHQGLLWKLLRYKQSLSLCYLHEREEMESGEGFRFLLTCSWNGF